MTNPTTPSVQCFFFDTGRGPCSKVTGGDYCNGCGQTICDEHDPALPTGQHKPEDHLEAP